MAKKYNNFSFIVIAIASVVALISSATALTTKYEIPGLTPLSLAIVTGYMANNYRKESDKKPFLILALIATFVNLLAGYFQLSNFIK